MVKLFSYAKGNYNLFLKQHLNKCIGTRRGVHSPSSTTYNEKIGNNDTNPKKRPWLIIKDNSVKNILNGFPWVYSKDVKNDNDLFLYSPCIVNIKDEFNENIGVGIYNKNSTIASRILTMNVNENINEEFFNNKIKKAYEKRLELFPNDNFFRVVNAEGDFLPGIVIDKYNKLVSVQVNASGMDVLLHIILKSIENVLNPDTIILKNDSHIRKLEKLSLTKLVYKGLYKPPIEIRENGLTFFTDILKGQKTGWYYDQRDNRSMLISYCKDKNVLDLFSYVGGFGITLAYYGANEVTCVDSSYLAIENGIKSAQYNNVLNKVNFVHACVKKFLNVSLHVKLETPHNRTNNIPLLEKSDEQTDECLNIEFKEQNDNNTIEMKKTEHDKKSTLFSDMQNIYIYEKSKDNRIDLNDIEKLLIKNNNYDFFQKKYDVILIDPPPLARNNYLLPSALKVYQKLLYVSFKIIQKPGYVFVSSCNKLIGYNELVLCIRRALNWAKCEGVIIGEGRVSSDHPVHVSLPETKYLTSILLMIT
ncbi:S-adenosylmethionine-dependent methyltransferase, putative [Plasmodium vinckei lentum]|uniref:S-adenosylmethionine-dependent methyltransferase, putative n=1 Tax=Plasmodium vinckei lentum TaxID=138297 RepID=A0A6V7SMB7_PLAVN|nr:S-adenosylmethionine-dependent methyltransferase, putative [Plasmodium vinckei lentum]